MQQSCSPNDAKPSTHIFRQSAKVAISIRLGMEQGQPRKQLWTTLCQAEDSYYELMHWGCKQGCETRCKCAPANFQYTALCYFEGDFNADKLHDSIRIFQSTLYKLLQLYFCSSYEFIVLSEHWIATSELIVCRFFEGSNETHISPFRTSTTRPWAAIVDLLKQPPVHKVTVNTIKNKIINLLLQLTYFNDFDDLLWSFVQHDRQTLCFSIKNIALQWTQSNDNYKPVFLQLTYFSDFDLVSDLLWEKKNTKKLCSTRSTNFVVFCKEYKFKCIQSNFVLGSFESDT